jgi:hypothetical protein
MKKILLVLSVFALVFSMNAQKLTVNEVDQFTGKTKKLTSFYNLAKTDVGMIRGSVIRINDSRFLSVSCTFDLGCVGARDNYIIFLYADGSSVKLNDDFSDIDCSNESNSLYSIDALKTEGITHIRLRMSKYYTDGAVYGTYSLTDLMNAVN